MTEDTPSPIKLENITHESSQHWENLRSELKNWKKRMKVSEAEVAKGLRISRQATNRFINESNPTLPIYRNNLIWLWEYVTKEENIEKLTNEDAKVNRRKLLENTANDILEKSGFLGIKRQSIIAEDISTSEKFHRLIFRLSNKSLSGRDIWNIEELVINQLTQSQVSLEDQKPFDKIYEVKKWLMERHENIDTYWTYVESTLKRYKRLGKKSFAKAEVLELFQSIAENKVSRKNKEQNIRVIRYETRTLNSVYNRLLHPNSQEYKEGISVVLEDILREGILTENLLRDLNEEHTLFNPINEVRLHCRISNLDDDRCLFYRSCSSSTGNMISAIQESMGHDLELKDLSSHVLAEGSDSIVRVAAILKSNQSFYIGRWVDIDMILSFAQAIVIASEDWVKDKITDKKTYYEVCIKLAEILEKIDTLIQKTYEYGLVQTSNDKDEIVRPIDVLKQYIQDIDSVMERYFESKSGSHNRHIILLNINKRQAQLAKSKYYHIVGNVENARNILAKIKSQIEDERKAQEGEDLFDPSIILFEVEEMIFNFYTSEGKFFDGKLWHGKLEVLELRIQKYLRGKKGVSLLTDTLYRSLAELYGNVGRFEFYNCDDNTYNIERLTLALKHSQRAAYFAMKTDDEKRASHWLARCGRILCRLNSSKEAKNYIDAAEEILQRSITSEHQYKRRSEALKLEINIAKGERLLLENDSAKAIKFFVSALEGAIYLQFARIMAGSLYGLYRASEGNVTLVIQKLSSFIERLEKEGEQSMEEKRIASIPVEDYEIFKITIEFLKEVSKYESDDEKKLLRGKLKEAAKNIWNNWAKLAGNNKLHFIAKHMEEDTFVSVIRNREI